MVTIKLYWTSNLNNSHFPNIKQKITVFHQQQKPLHDSIQIKRCVNEVRDILNFDRDDKRRKKEELLSKFNEEQKRSFEEIDKSVTNDGGKFFYPQWSRGMWENNSD